MGSHDLEKGDVHEKKATSPLYYIILAGCLMIALGLALGLGLGLRAAKSELRKAPVETTTTAKSEPSETFSKPVETTTTAPVDEDKSKTGTYRFAAVAADAEVCSKIGTEILAKKGGSAVDAAIATTLCLGVVHRQSCGIGGGFFMTIYNRENGSVDVLDARERAPLEANSTMYINRTDGLTSTRGGLAIGVPGEIKGYWAAHQKYGRLPWKDLFQPTIKMCRDGVTITRAIHIAITRYPELLKNNSHTMYFDPKTGETVKIGDKVQYPVLAQTLETIADKGEAAFYDGELTDDIVQDIRDNDGIISQEDLRNYTATWRTPISVTLRGNVTLYSNPPPGSGAVLSFILNILDGYGFTPDSISSNEKSILTYHRIVEAMKFAYAKRTSLGDEDFVDVKELVANMTNREYVDSIRGAISDDKTFDTDYYGPTFYDDVQTGTTHASVLDGQGNAVAITSTINTYFGSKVRGSRTGIAFNNEMDDFSTPGTINSFGVPASSANFIEPRKRPLSSMSPTIFVNSTTGDVILIVGASGGTRITTSAALVSLYTLKLGLSVGEAVDQHRVHHQLLPKTISIEKGFPQPIIDGLKAKGHNMTLNNPSSTVQAIFVKDGELHAVSDRRKGGAPDGY